ncbi:N-acetylmuramoyl-L-alanine amidase LytC precursor [Moorella thermoacetica]|uniref:N-acetylmuramoyl-L-alanine amidase LytC n=1 Tax=Neomoorella thermoacetica TaxID=1525 RepID=A0A1J5JHJ6_NEOTH|nr:N-acetylmuramoyl-L-alanine amidase [Moorella thermoacetica]OIQ08645.1 N-acetylmuramoyl-L-alanine amidase LytC precursor [Moorella thermoacetica]
MVRRLTNGRWGLTLLILGLMYIIMLGLIARPAAADPGITLVLNGSRVNPSVPAYTDSNGRTMVPVRFVMEHMGGRVEWLDAEQGIVVSRGATTLKMWIGKRQAQVNGQAIDLDTVPVLQDGTSMVPVRFVAQAFGGKVEWDDASRTVSIWLGTASPAGQVRITGSYVNVRTGPGTSYGVIDVLPRDTLVQLLATGDGWYQVQLPDGRQGWVSASYSEVLQGNNQPQDTNPPGNNQPGNGQSPGNNPSPGNNQPGNEEPPSGQPLGTAIIGNKPVAILAGPNPVEKQVGVAPAGSRLPIWQQKGDWWLVELDNGQRGWLASSLATFSPEKPGQDNGGSETGNGGTAPGKGNQGAGSSDSNSLKITGVTVNPGPDWIEVTVQGTRPFTFKSSRWADHLIFDIPGATLAVAPGQDKVEVNRQPLARVRLGQYDANTVRVVCDLNGAANFTTTTAGSTIIIRLQKPSVRGAKIVIDPGHGTDPQGSDPGAIGPSGVQEKDVNLAISRKLAELLRAAGATVYMTRDGETTPYTLSGRAYYANEVGADLFICIHSNASLSPSASGTSTYFYAPPGTALGEQRDARQRLATLIQRDLVAAIGRRDLGVKEANFAVLRNTKMPSVLVETAFISNPTEEQLLASPDFQALVAQGIFNGISDYLSGQ